MRKKWKRKSGYVMPNLTIPNKYLIKYDLFVNSYYSDWDDWRDGMRNWFGDNKLIKKLHYGYKDWEEMYEQRLRMNKKQYKLLVRRKKRLRK